MRTSTAILLALLSACGSPSESPSTTTTTAIKAPPPPVAEVPEDQVLARVGGIPVTIAEFTTAAARRIPADSETLSAEERAEVLDELISEKMLYLEAKRLGIDRDPKVQKIMVSTLLKRTVYSRVRNSDFTEEELRAYFEANGDEFVVPEKRRIKRVFVRAGGERSIEEATARAGEARTKILADPSEFKSIAAEYSEDPYRRRGGDLGFVASVGKPGVPKAIVDKAFTMDDGAISEVFEADDGANVIYMAGRRERIERTFEQMKGSVLRKVKNDRLTEMLDSYIDQVDDIYTVETKDGRIDEVELAPINGKGPALRLPGAPGGPETELTGGHGGH